MLPVNATDSGRISRTAAASMKPAPSARKYFRYWRDHSRCRIKSPPRMLAPAAVNPSSSASSMREAGTEMDGALIIIFSGGMYVDPHFKIEHASEKSAPQNVSVALTCGVVLL